MTVELKKSKALFVFAGLYVALMMAAAFAKLCSFETAITSILAGLMLPGLFGKKSAEDETREHITLRPPPDDIKVSYHPVTHEKESGEHE